MILIDTSAFVEFLRATGSPTHREVRRLIDANRVATTDPVVMEVLAGARDDSHASQLKGFLLRFEHIPANTGDYEQAAAIYRACRAKGATIRSLVDCLVAAVAVREGLRVLHNDRDFPAIRDATELLLHEPAP